MKKIIYVCLCLSLNVFPKDNMRFIEDAALAQKQILLSQLDFDSGTYRIKSGGYYKFIENVLFDPQIMAEKKRNDKPASGWFASITIETTEPVVIDLNTFTLASSAEFDEQHIFNVFAQIELDNCPFSGTLYGFPNPHQAFVNFKGDLSYVSASNVIIKNGTLGRSGHWGIHGNNNSNIHLENLIIKDWEVRGIELNGLVRGSLKKIEISGLEHSIKTSVPLVGVLHVKQVLQHLAAQGFKDAQVRLQNLDEFLTKNPGLLNPPQSLPVGTIGGIFIAGGGVSNVDFPVTTSLCSHAMNMTGGRTCSDIQIEEINIHDLGVNSVQFATIGSKYTGGQGHSIGIENLGLLPGGALFWKDAYDQNGIFNPNEPLLATVFAARAFAAHHPDAKKLLPKNFDKIAQSILEKNEALFLENVIPIYTYPSHKIKGLFGIRVEGAENVLIQNCTVSKLSSVGSNVTEIQKLRTVHHATNNNVNDPGAPIFLPDYRGNDIWGYEFAVCKNCIIRDCVADTIISNNGNPFGFELIADTDSIRVENCHATNIIAYGDTIDSNINLPSESYGFRVQNTQNSNVFTHCSASIITAPIRSFGFAAENCANAIFDSCAASHVSTSTQKHSLELEKQQVSFGFNAEGAHNTHFNNCISKVIHLIGPNVTVNAPIAAGFACTENDMNTTIVDCDSHEIMANHGNAIDLFVDDTSNMPLIN
ncbi:MAG: hypothetical protein AMXMBFR12_08370 [Candidatus Babeliales bacterium]